MCTSYHVTVKVQPIIALFDTGTYISVISQTFLNLYLKNAKAKLLKSHTHTVTPGSGANLGPIGHWHLTFRLDNKCFTNKSIICKNLPRNLISGLNWHSNYTICCNWNINRHQYITYNKKYLCPSMLSTDSKPIPCNEGTFYLQPRSI